MRRRRGTGRRARPSCGRAPPKRASSADAEGGAPGEGDEERRDDRRTEHGAEQQRELDVAAGPCRRGGRSHRRKRKPGGAQGGRDRHPPVARGRRRWRGQAERRGGQHDDVRDQAGARGRSRPPAPARRRAARPTRPSQVGPKPTMAPGREGRWRARWPGSARRRRSPQPRQRPRRATHDSTGHQLERREGARAAWCSASAGCTSEPPGRPAGDHDRRERARARGPITPATIAQ